MYTTRQKPYRDENQKPRKTHKNNMPSFSSSLLDEIYRSIDGNSEISQDFNAYKEKPAKRQSESFARACLVEKWMEYEENERKAEAKRTQLLHENELLFFSSTSSSSDSSGALSSSDTEYFGSQTKPKVVSCFSTRPKPVRTGPARCDDYQSNHKNKMETDDLIKSKSRALKIYANLKKVKQPISPGGRLTTFINSLFNNGNAKKSKNVETNKGFRDLRSPNAALLSSTCSSASSFSRSCLSKYSPKSKEKIRNNGVQRTVRFHPVSVIVDEDSRPCGQKSIYDEDCDKYGRTLPPHALNELKVSKREKNRKFEKDAQNVLKGYNSQRIIDDISSFRKIRDEVEEDEDDYDGMSDSSSDLFELDHLAIFGKNRYCEELPVYETTHFETNRAIASGLIR